MNFFKPAKTVTFAQPLSTPFGKSVPPAAHPVSELMDVCCACSYMVYEKSCSQWRCSICKEPYCNGCANQKKHCLKDMSAPPENRPSQSNKFF